MSAHHLAGGKFARDYFGDHIYTFKLTQNGKQKAHLSAQTLKRWAPNRIYIERMTFTRQ